MEVCEMKAFLEKWLTLAQPWIPFAFATWVSFGIMREFPIGTIQPWDPAFFSAFPLVFFFLGFILLNFQLEIRKLRREVDQLRVRPSTDPVAA
jgi:hypothetical protein